MSHNVHKIQWFSLKWSKFKWVLINVFASKRSTENVDGDWLHFVDHYNITEILLSTITLTLKIKLTS